ncbi:MAG: DNA repair protein RadC [Muribaculaceae bacterium]|nr:DNA repair protein RadC [Muribaculaceae bacterium]
MRDSDLIRNLADDEKPREKALSRGIRTLADAELLAILLRTGLKGKSVIQVSREILSLCEGDLATLCRMTPQQLARLVPGIGPTKAITVTAAIEFGARCQCELQKITDRPQITCSQAIHNHMRATLERLPHEEFWVLTLNRANRIESRWMISQGGMAATIVDLRLLFKKVIDSQASAIAIVHNHPSGQLKPSAEDDALTRRITDAAALLDIRVIDHVIISPAGFYSYFDSGRL